MNTFERRRVVLASVVTLIALPALWVLNRDSAASSASPNLGAAGIEVAKGGHDEAPSTSEYQPEPPLFVGGDDTVAQPGVINVAVPPAQGTNTLAMKATFHRYEAVSDDVCTTMLVPDGATLTVVNVDNGQRITCRNTYGIGVPAGADLVLNTAVYVLIGDLADAPLSVRVSW